MVLTLVQDIVKLMFAMTNASECHRDAVFVCGGDRFVVFDRSAETGDWCQALHREVANTCLCDLPVHLQTSTDFLPPGPLQRRLRCCHNGQVLATHTRRI